MAEVGGDGMIGETEEEPMLTLENGARAVEAVLPQQRRLEPRLRRPAGVQTLGRASFGEILDDPRGHAAGDAEGVGGLQRVEAEGRGGGGGGAEAAEHGGRMEAGPVNGGRSDHGEAA